MMKIEIYPDKSDLQKLIDLKKFLEEQCEPNEIIKISSSLH